MGGRKSSSKKKSSKKKSLKVSSKMQKRKIRRNKFKKLSSSEDYTSSSDYSCSLQSSSSSSSEDDYSRKSRRHSRDVKRVKKRTRRRSSSRDVSEGSPPVKKRKRSNRKSLDSRRKLQKKKRRRHTSISSKSSDSRSSSCRCETSVSSRDIDSRSFSTCQPRTTLEDFPSPKIKSRKKKKEKRNPNEPSIEKRSTSRGPKCSSCNYHACSCSPTHSGKGYAEENNNTRRLRSVIIVPEKTEEKEGDEQGTDMLKEEILNKHCASCRDCDSNDQESKRKVASCSCFSSNQTTQVENLIINDVCPPNNETIGPKNTGGGIDPHPNKAKEVSPDKGDDSGISDNNANSGSEDLETLLRKKALENLQKFRKELQTNRKSGVKEKKNESDINRLSPSKTEVVPDKSPEQENREGLSLNQEIGCRNNLVINEEFSNSTKIELSTPAEKEDHTTEPAFVDEAEPDKLSCPTVQAYTMESSLASKRNIIKTSVPLRSGVLNPDTGDNLGMGAGDASVHPTVETTSSVRSTSTSEGHTSNHQPDETKDGSQFEKKTMSVMRGGEMVQVSYKVYIPKRAPALARRQLKR